MSSTIAVVSSVRRTSVPALTNGAKNISDMVTTMKAVTRRYAAALGGRHSPAALARRSAIWNAAWNTKKSNISPLGCCSVRYQYRNSWSRPDIRNAASTPTSRPHLARTGAYTDSRRRSTAIRFHCWPQKLFSEVTASGVLNCLSRLAPMSAAETSAIEENTRSSVRKIWTQ
uniref:Uncharacterized protein n=1 Tax=Zea mays TaxID=4577 RepID=A0A804NG25_MAIZE